jgi:hypothetical protein
MVLSDVPAAIKSVEAECDDSEWQYGVACRLNVCAGVISAFPIADNFSVLSRDVVRIVDGVGSNG